MLERGVLYDFQHDAPYADGSTRRQAPAEPDQGAVPGELPDVEMDPAQESNHFGVVGVEWIQSRFGRLGLVTGGNDGANTLPHIHHDFSYVISRQAASDYGIPFVRKRKGGYFLKRLRMSHALQSEIRSKVNIVSLCTYSSISLLNF